MQDILKNFNFHLISDCIQTDRRNTVTFMKNNILSGYLGALLFSNKQYVISEKNRHNAWYDICDIFYLLELFVAFFKFNC